MILSEITKSYGANTADDYKRWIDQGTSASEDDERERIADEKRRKTAAERDARNNAQIASHNKAEFDNQRAINDYNRTHQPDNSANVRHDPEGKSDDAKLRDADNLTYRSKHGGMSQIEFANMSASDKTLHDAPILVKIIKNNIPKLLVRKGRYIIDMLNNFNTIDNMGRLYLNRKDVYGIEMICQVYKAVKGKELISDKAKNELVDYLSHNSKEVKGFNAKNKYSDDVKKTVNQCIAYAAKSK